MQPQVSSVEVKLNNHGRYTWKINVVFNDNFEDAVKTTKAIDSRLRDEFPDHVSKGTGRVSTFEEDQEVINMDMKKKLIVALMAKKKMSAAKKPAAPVMPAMPMKKGKNC